MSEVLLRVLSADDLGAVRALCAIALDGEDDPGGVADLLVGGAGGWRSGRFSTADWSVSRRPAGGRGRTR